MFTELRKIEKLFSKNSIIKKIVKACYLKLRALEEDENGDNRIKLNVLIS